MVFADGHSKWLPYAEYQGKLDIWYYF